MANIRQITLPTGQGWFIDRIESLGYKVDKGGLCFGVSRAAELFILSEMFNYFNKIWFSIYEKVSIKDKNLNKTELDLLRESELDLLAADELALLDAVVLSAIPCEHPFLFQSKSIDQFTRLSTEILCSEKLQEWGGVVEQMIPSAGYTEQGLIQYFEALHSVLKEKRIDFPISINLINTSHAITIGYCPNELNAWVYVEASRLPGLKIELHDYQQLAKEVMQSFTDISESAVIYSIFSVTKNNERALRKILFAWRQKQVWKSLHDIDQIDFSAYTNQEILFFILLRIEQEDRSIFEKLPYLKVDFSEPLDGSSDPLLHTLIKEQWCGISFITDLLNCNVNPNMVNENGETPLYLAIKKKDASLVSALLRYGADADFCDENDVPLIYFAIKEGSKKIVRSLLKYSKQTENFINYINYYGKSLLHIATISQNVAITELLLAYGANPNMYNKISPLYLAAECGNTEMIKLLLSYGANIDDRNLEAGITALYTACEFNYLESVEVLLSAGADASVTIEEDGRSLLHKAVEGNNLEMAALLLKYKTLTPANYWIHDLSYPLLYFAISNNNYEMVSLLLAHGANPMLMIGGRYKMTPFDYALKTGNEEIISLLKRRVDEWVKVKPLLRPSIFRDLSLEFAAELSSDKSDERNMKCN